MSKNSAFYHEIMNSIGTNSNNLRFSQDSLITAIPNNCFDIFICAEGRYTMNTTNGSFASSKGIYGLGKKAISVYTNNISSGLHINLLPEQMSLLTPIPLGELSGELLDVSEVFNVYTNELLDISAVLDNNYLLQQFFIKVLNKSENPDLIKTAHIVRLIEQFNGNLTIKEIAKQTFITERTLQRLFYKFIGLSPKAYSKNVRFKHISQVYHFNKFTKEESLHDLIIAFGYYDYSHFVHECNQITGLSPTEYFKNLDPVLSLLYNEL